MTRARWALLAPLLVACGAPTPTPRADLRIAELPALDEQIEINQTQLAAPPSGSSSLEPRPAPDPELARAARALAGIDGDAPSRAAELRDYDERLGEPLGRWARAELGDADGATVVYPFSGPDFVTAHRLFPRASRYVLVSREAAGRVRAGGALDGARLARQTRALEGFLRRGFFLTRDMGRDFPDGVADTLAALATLEGFVVESEQSARVDAAGQLRPDPRGEALRLSLRRADGARVELDFVSLDLSDPWLRRAPGAVAWLASVARDRALLKAASHLLQQPGFRAARDALVAHASVVVQDETGVGYEALSPSFDVTLYGAFTAVNPLFASTPQRELARAYRERTDVRPLPFSLGYRKRAGSCLLVARRRP